MWGRTKTPPFYDLSEILKIVSMPEEKVRTHVSREIFFSLLFSKDLTWISVNKGEKLDALGYWPFSVFWQAKEYLLK